MQKFEISNLYGWIELYVMSVRKIEHVLKSSLLILFCKLQLQECKVLEIRSMLYVITILTNSLANFNGLKVIESKKWLS